MRTPIAKTMMRMRTTATIIPTTVPTSVLADGDAVTSPGGGVGAPVGLLGVVVVVLVVLVVVTVVVSVVSFVEVVFVEVDVVAGVIGVVEDTNGHVGVKVTSSSAIVPTLTKKVRQ